MRILHVSDTFLPVLGGIEVLVDDLSRHQRQAGHEVHVLTAAKGPAEPGLTRLPGRFAPVEPVLDAVAPEVVHCHSSLVSPLAWRAARAAAERGIPALLTMHSLVTPTSLTAAPLALAGRVVPRTVPWTAVSSVAARALEPVVEAPVSVLPNGFDVDGTRTAHPGTAEQPTIVSVMRLARRKRPLALISMLAGVRDLLGDLPWRAVIVGDGPQAAAVRAAVVTAGLQDRVRLTGRLDRDEVLHLLAGADLYLAPARLESFGLAALEARCSGLPVVAMRSGGVGEFVRDGVDGWLVDDDSAMTLKTAQLLATRGLLAQAGQACRSELPDLDWPATVARSLDAYEFAALSRHLTSTVQVSGARVIDQT
ncbi:MAG: glycosyltransferase family 4 protein [Actinomycetales bacterium]